MLFIPRTRLRRLIGLLLPALLAGLCPACAVAAATAARPNLLLITFDDMNADSAGYLGSKLGATPNLDGLARTAYIFEHAHVTAPICQPGREALLTGRVPHRSGGLGFNPIRTDVPTLTEVLRAHGYFAAAIEKIGHMQPASKFPWDLALAGAGKNPPLMRARMEQCLRAAAEAGKPFFINANITDPHRPFPGAQLTAKQVGKSAAHAEVTRVIQPAEVIVPSFLEDIPEVRKEVAQYFTGVARGDRSFGEILAALAAAGRERATVVAVLSDHGMSFPFSKATVYRNGTWSPLLLRWPALATPKRDRTNFVSSVDLMPTLLELLGVPAPDGMDGRSLLPLTCGERQAGRDHVITHVNTVSSGRAFPQRCVRTAMHSYQWHGWADGQTSFRVEAMNGLSFNAQAEAARTDARIQRRVEQFTRGVPEQLFDLTKDPDERVNVIQQPEQHEVLKRLRLLLLNHMERTEDPQLAAFRALVTR